MMPIKVFKNKFKRFLKSIDTITTKLLTLVLFVITIPLMVIGDFSTDIINKSMFESSSELLNLNKRIFEQKSVEEENKLKVLTQTAVERIIKDNTSAYKVLKDMKKNYNLDFCAILSRNNSFAVKFGDFDKKNLSSSLKKIIGIAFTDEVVSSSEIINDNIYKIVVMPIRRNIGNVSSVLLTAESFDKIPVPQEMKNITNATVVFYKTDENKAKIINSNNSIFRKFSKLRPGTYFDGTQLQNPAELSLIIPIKNYFNEKIGDAYIGLSKDNFIIPGNRNVKSIGIIAVISLLVAVIIAGLFARALTDPIIKLVEAAESIALGDLDHQVKIKGNDEMAQLAKSFNQMSTNLKKQEHLRDNFVATLTHDLKVPMLAENQTVTYLLKEAYGKLTDEQREVLELIKSTNNSSLEMIGTLLEVYRYDSGNVRLFASEFDIIELLNDSIAQIKSLADDKTIQINVESNRNKIIVKADKREIKRVIHNIISNSINNGIHRGFINCKVEISKNKKEYKPKTDIDDYTTLTRTLDLSNSVILSIEDNGIGIAREDMPLLFQRFSLSKGRKPAGAGLGLYYSYQVIIQHNGNIWAESSEKGGSLFTFTLPIQL